MSRWDAYVWLARQLSVTLEHAHISRMSDKNLLRTIDKSGRYYRKLTAKSNKEQERNDATHRRQRARTSDRKRGGKWKRRSTSGPR